MADEMSRRRRTGRPDSEEHRAKRDRTGKGRGSREERRLRRARRTMVKTPSEITAQVLKYTLLYFAFLFYWEFILNIAIYGNPFGRSIWTVLFLIPSAFFMSALTGWFKKSLPNRIGSLIVTFAVTAFYIAELIYYNSFGSLFSFSMIGMGGDAIANFWVCIVATVKESAILLILLFVPFLLVLIIGEKKFVQRMFCFRGYFAPLHLLPLVAAVLCWILIVCMLPLSGKGESSVYAAYHSTTTDTDTGSEKLGALTNILVEMKVSLLGSGGSAGTRGEAGDVEEEEEGVAALVVEKVTEASDNENVPETETAVQEAPVPVEDLGFNAFEALDFQELANKAEDDDIRSVCEYLATQKPTAKNEYTGIFEGYNLIYICAESFSNYVLYEEICPTLTRMSKEGIVLTNYYNSYKNTTTNGEYSFVTGLWPDVSRKAKGGTKTVGTMPQSVDNCMYPAFGHMFNATGRNTLGFHNYKGSYYDRQHSWPNMGIKGRFKSTMTLTHKWPTSDLEMMEQVTDDFINEKPFTAYFMTFSGHGVYSDDNNIVKKNHSTVKKLAKAAGLKMRESQICYLAANYELELAMQELMKRLEEAGQLEKTVIVLAGDHYPYYVKKETRDRFAGHVVDQNFEMYKSTCIMWVGDMKTPIEIDTPCCIVDILPTVMNMFNVPFDSRLYSGTDIFGDGMHIAQLYNRNFITEYVKYNQSSGKATWIDKEDPESPYAAVLANWSDEDRQAYLDRIISIVKQRYNYSLAVENTDYFKYVWENVDGLPRGAEVIAENTEDDGGENEDFDEDADMMEEG